MSEGVCQRGVVRAEVSQGKAGEAAVGGGVSERRCQRICCQRGDVRGELRKKEEGEVGSREKSNNPTQTRWGIIETQMSTEHYC